MVKKRATRRVSSPQKKVRKKVTRSDRNLSPFSLLFYGPPGIGKTTTVAQFPETRFIVDSDELGIKILLERGLVPEPLSITIVDSWDGLLEEIENLEDCQNLVLEALTGLEALGHRWECDTNWGGDMSKEGFYSYSQGPKNFARFQWPKLLNLLNGLHHRGVNTTITAHSDVKESKNPQGHNWEQYKVFCDKQTWQHTSKWAQAVGFYYMEVDVNAKKKVMDSTRVINFDASPYYDAKNWIGLSSPMVAEGEPADIGKELYRQLIGEN